jgi:adenosylcobyric acid synthase
VRDVRACGLRHDVELEGYEIHLGRTTGPDCARPFALIDGVEDGATSPDGRVFGTYLHGLFGSAAFRKALLAEFGIAGGAFDHEAEVERALDAIATRLETHLDCNALFALAR